MARITITHFRMDVPECNVCHVPLDEEEHQPRHLGCSHDACTTCIKALINNGSFECPMCRRVIKANKADDLPINHGVVQILRLFKGLKISENNPDEEGATSINKEVCNIHKCTADKKCITCKVWVCVQCKEFHIPDIGCEIQEYNEVLKTTKREHKEQVELTLSSIRNDLAVIEGEKKKLEKEIEMLNNRHKNFQKAVEDGTKVLNEVVAAASKVDKANTSKELNESCHISNEWHQFAQIWRKKNAKSGLTNSLLQILKGDQEVYASMDIDGKSFHCKLSTKEGNIILHCFRVSDSKWLKRVSYEQVQRWLPEVRDLVFLDLAILGEVKGRVTIRLRQDLLSYAKNIPMLFTGEKGHSLVDIPCVICKMRSLGFAASSVIKQINHFQRDSNAGDIASQGAILASWLSQKFEHIYIYHEKYMTSYGSNYEVFGQVETGLETVKLCRNHGNQNEVTVADCGLVIKEHLFRLR